ncbi:hypothetical protein CROQUDRAFT_664156 [Cronartium quercuum f. sp. fusiforme G11]|uniref:Uncharacterized protein n=1 Tax=Cronartium quercuum f. sp. fusiforme G11 TaxID=708437 RepID=A0A9P6N8X7_9BASI|nr:hypothetical protein CROQUDRAFT_664156 [Cronartium quercuum f. sp. fusiforme G11]
MCVLYGPGGFKCLLATLFDPVGESKKKRSAESPAEVLQSSSKGWEPEKLLRRN